MLAMTLWQRRTWLVGASEWVWTWQGKTKIGDKKVTHELRKSK